MFSGPSKGKLALSHNGSWVPRQKDRIVQGQAMIAVRGFGLHAAMHCSDCSSLSVHFGAGTQRQNFSKNFIL